MVGYLDVWDQNLKSALKALEQVSRNYPLVAIDTEFPGDPLGSDPKWMIEGRSQEAYDVLKRNVDVSNLVTLGITFSEPNGRRAGLRTFVFNMRFNLDVEVHAESGVDFLKRNGMDFKQLKERGCDHKEVIRGIKHLFADKSRQWITFQGLVYYLLQKEAVKLVFKYTFLTRIITYSVF